MQQNARVVMAQLMREFRLAGYNPSQATAIPGVVGTLPDNPVVLGGGTTPLSIQGDFDNDGVVETLTYRIDSNDSAHPWLTREEDNNGNPVKFGDNIENVIFTFYDAANCKMDAAACPGLGGAAARRVTIQVVARTNKEDADFKHPVFNDGYRRRTLESDVILRNTSAATDTTPPECPTNVQALATLDCRVIRVTWNAAPDPWGDLAGYYVYYDQAAIDVDSSPFSNITEDGSPDYTYEIAMPVDGTYNIAVTSYDRAGNLCDFNLSTPLVFDPVPSVANGVPVMPIPGRIQWGSFLGAQSAVDRSDMVDDKPPHPELADS